MTEAQHPYIARIQSAETMDALEHLYNEIALLFMGNVKACQQNLSELSRARAEVIHLQVTALVKKTTDSNHELLAAKILVTEYDERLNQGLQQIGAEIEAAVYFSAAVLKRGMQLNPVAGRQGPDEQLESVADRMAEDNAFFADVLELYRLNALSADIHSELFDAHALSCPMATAARALESTGVGVLQRAVEMVRDDMTVPLDPWAS